MNAQAIELAVSATLDRLLMDDGLKGYAYAVPIGISNRHVHLSKEMLSQLFGQDYQLTAIKPLSQPGEYACQEVVDIAVGDRLIKNVRILGPLRSKTQVEISQTDARFLKVNLKVRNSGDLLSTHSVTLINKERQVTLDEGLIIATRHLHLTPEDATRFNIQEGERVTIRLNSLKSGYIQDVYCKISEQYSLELHLDTDDGNAFLVNNGDIAELVRWST